MPLTSTEQPYTTPQEQEDELKRNSRWTPRFASPMSAAVSVHYFGFLAITCTLVQFFRPRQGRIVQLRPDPDRLQVGLLDRSKMWRLNRSTRLLPTICLGSSRRPVRRTSSWW